LPAFRHRVHTFARVLSASRAHCKLGCLRRFPIGLNLVARTRLEYPPPKSPVFPQIVQIRAIVLNCVFLCYHKRIIMQELVIFSIITLIISVVVHEVSHGYVANILGDPTAELAGRLTLNPIKHLDPVGSILIPGFLLLTQSPLLFGWAKPVPYNPYNLRGGKWGPGLVAFAGPGANILIALIFSLLIRTNIFTGNLLFLSSIIVFTNLILALFNLIPIPPLDGSKVLGSVLPNKIYFSYYRKYEYFLERYGLLVTFLLIFFLFSFILPILSTFVEFLFQILTGIDVNSIL